MNTLINLEGLLASSKIDTTPLDPYKVLGVRRWATRNEVSSVMYSLLERLAVFKSDHGYDKIKRGGRKKGTAFKGIFSGPRGSEGSSIISPEPLIFSTLALHSPST